MNQKQNAKASCVSGKYLGPDEIPGFLCWLCCKPIGDLQPTILGLRLMHQECATRNADTTRRIRAGEFDSAIEEWKAAR